MYRLNEGSNLARRLPGIGQLLRHLKRMIYLRVEKRLWTFFETEEVQAGPFSGTKFPHKSGNCSVFFPKLIGCYEAELHQTFEELRHNNYDEVWDIGAADGYYAAGLAIMFPEARIRAWEASEQSAQNCHLTCMANGLEKQVVIGGVCTNEDLTKLSLINRVLIVCDIEGHEMDLFDEATVVRLGRSDLVIELHEDFAPGVTAKLLARFERTHKVVLIDSVHDERKVIEYAYNPLPLMSPLLRRYATAERRYRKMQWLVATAR